MKWIGRLRGLPLHRAALYVSGAATTAYVALAVADLAPRPQELWEDPIEVRVETDPRVFRADLPYRWAQFEHVFTRPTRELGRPPFLCHHRQAWAKRHGGIDASRTVFRVYIEGREDDRTVVLGSPRVVYTDRQPPLRGTHVACPVGGAEARVRKLVIDLDERTGCFTNKDGACIRGSPQFTLRKGEVEIIEVSASTKRCFCTWSIELPYTVGSEEHTRKINDADGEPFKTSATRRAQTFSFADGRWYRGIHLGPPR